jgi:hypothetical protein
VLVFRNDLGPLLPSFVRGRFEGVSTMERRYRFLPVTSWRVPNIRHQCLVRARASGRLDFSPIADRTDRRNTA